MSTITPEPHTTRQVFEKAAAGGSVLHAAILRAAATGQALLEELEQPWTNSPSQSDHVARLLERYKREAAMLAAVQGQGG